MKKMLCIAALLTISAFATTALADGKGKINGKKEFEEHCVSCHADGGNIVNPAKTLKKLNLQANGVKSWQDIVKKMRNPGPGMTKFEKKDVSDKEARAIAEYILKTFK
ncbi:c-type cytochrome [Geobacter argillaceus]|uniref:Cytochrome c6 n=1 Tax=Geobacter argillaceus TaxID=345631 RepID=A0A562VMD8_9BACT|nr:c-type cytochrome [Geobacter argillaceus]TWJ18897.1 cytochrome c6 [Geobacter argillaceus]